MLQDEIEKAVALHQPKALFITSPNNPDGSEISEEVLERCLKLPTIVVLDQAYIEFSDRDTEREMKRVIENPKQNLVVLRTFSKRAALAGLRVGYRLSPFRYLDSTREVYSSNLFNLKLLIR